MEIKGLTINSVQPSSSSAPDPKKKIRPQNQDAVKITLRAATPASAPAVAPGGPASVDGGGGPPSVGETGGTPLD